MHKTVAIYARVSSDRQKDSGTIASQTAALRFARGNWRLGCLAQAWLCLEPPG